jgi:hypothetical protein
MRERSGQYVYRALPNRGSDYPYSQMRNFSHVSIIARAKVDSNLTL